MIDVRADDVEAVRGVVALQPNLAECVPAVIANLGGREGESLGRDVNHARVRRTSLLRQPRPTAIDDRERQPACIELPIRTTIPSRR